MGIGAVRQKLGKSRAIIDRWSRTYKWVERVRAWDNHLQHEARRGHFFLSVRAFGLGNAPHYYRETERLTAVTGEAQNKRACPTKSGETAPYPASPASVFSMTCLICSMNSAGSSLHRNTYRRNDWNCQDRLPSSWCTHHILGISSTKSARKTRDFFDEV